MHFDCFCTFLRCKIVASHKGKKDQEIFFTAIAFCATAEVCLTATQAEREKGREKIGGGGEIREREGCAAGP